MLTGDNQATAQWVSDQVGPDEYFAEVLPKDKTARMKAVQARGALVAMTSDSVNDAPALAQADGASPSAPGLTWQWRLPTS